MRTIFFILLTLLISCKSEITQEKMIDENMTRIPGTRILIDIPDGFELSYGVPQLRNDDGFGFEFGEYGLSFEDIMSVETPRLYQAYPSLKGIGKKDKEHLGYQAAEIITETYYDGDSLRRHKLIFGDKSFSATIELSFPIGRESQSTSALIANLYKSQFDHNYQVDPYEHLPFVLELDGTEELELKNITSTGLAFEGGRYRGLSINYVEKFSAGANELDWFKSIFEPGGEPRRGFAPSFARVTEYGQNIDSSQINGNKCIGGTIYGINSADTAFLPDTTSFYSLQILFIGDGGGIVLQGEGGSVPAEGHEYFTDFMEKVKLKDS